MKRSIIVKYDLYLGVKHHEEASEQATEELNHLLADGWEIRHICPMSGHNHGNSSLCIVVLER